MAAPITLDAGQGARVDLLLATARTNRWRLAYRAGDPGYEVPVDLTGWTARAQLRRSTSAATVWAALTSQPGGGVVLGGPDGTVTLTLEPADTAADEWNGRSGVWDVELADPGGDVYRLAGGLFTCEARVTR